MKGKQIILRVNLAGMCIILLSCMTRGNGFGIQHDAGGSGWHESGPENSWQEPPLPDIRSEGLTSQELNNMRVYRDNIRSIVNVTTVSLYQSRFAGSYSQEGSGSGIIVSGQGYVLTNKHVVAGASYMVVTLYDGTNYQAKLVGIDAESDLGVIKFEPAGRKLHTIVPGRAGDLQIGQKVLALGNPFGLEGTLTIGIISGLNRPMKTTDGYLLKGMIQTDVAINPGNSGGALLNSRGELIGINTMIISPGGTGSIGISFAIPVETALRIVPELIQNGRINRGWIDIEALSMTPNLARQLDIPFIDYGILITAVLPGGNAEKAGLKGGWDRRSVGMGLNSINVGGDVITRIAGVDISDVLDYFSVLESSRPGEKYLVEFIRDGTVQSTKITLNDRPSP